MPVPPFVSPPPKRTVVAGVSEAAARGLARGLKSAPVALVVHGDPYEGLVAAAAAPTALLVLGVSAARFDAAAAIRALTSGILAEGVTIAAVGAPTRAAAERLLTAGATRVLPRSYERDLLALVRELLALDTQ
jgi:hypothetical protein